MYSKIGIFGGGFPLIIQVNMKVASLDSSPILAFFLAQHCFC